MVGVALASCSAPPPPPALETVLVQQRGDIAVQRAQVRVTNTSDVPVTLVSAIVESAALTAPAGGGTARPLRIGPGQTTDVPVPLTGLQCTDADSSPTVRLLLRDGGARVETVRPLDDPLGVVARLTAERCDVEAVASVARVSATHLSPGADGTGELVVSIHPTGVAEAGRLELVALRGTPLLRFADGASTALGVSVGPDDAPSIVRVSVTPLRCDAHAIAEDKVGTLFDLVARVDGREVVVPLERPHAVAEALLAFTARTCGLTP